MCRRGQRAAPSGRLLKQFAAGCAIAQYELCVGYGGGVPITVGELLEMPHLRLSLHSGASGLDRTVSWTHTTDLPEPWRWVAGGELLMTNGMSMPRTASGQEQLLRQLVEQRRRGIGDRRRDVRTAADETAPLGERRALVPRAVGRVPDAVRVDLEDRRRSHPAGAVTTTDPHRADLSSPAARLCRQGGAPGLTRALSRELDCPVMICDRRVRGPVDRRRHPRIRRSGRRREQRGRPEQG